MAGVDKEPTRTPIDGPTLFESVGRSYTRLFGTYATRDFCLCMVGQCYTECGEGAHNCWCWDIGNVQARVGGAYDWCDLHGAWEIVKGQRVNQTEHFRAFASLEEGVDQHLTFLHDHFPTAFVAANGGDGVTIAGGPASFAHELHAHGYFTASEADYVRNVSWFVQKYSALPPSLWEIEAAQTVQGS